MEDDAERMPASAAKRAHAVAHRYAIIPPGTAHRAVIDGEDHSFAGRKRHDMDTGLHPRPLRGKHELAALEIVRVGQEESGLQREREVAVKILMQAVVITGAVTQQKRRRPDLSCGMAAFDEVGIFVRKRISGRQPLTPVVRDRTQPPVKTGTERSDEVWQRIGEITIFAASETMSGHHHRAAEKVVAFVTVDESVALSPIKQRPRGSPTLVIQVACDAIPFDRVEPVVDLHVNSIARRSHANLPLLAVKRQAARRTFRFGTTPVLAVAS